MKYLFFLFFSISLFSEEVSFRLRSEDGLIETNGFCLFQGTSFSLKKIDGIWKEVPVEYKIRMRENCSKKSFDESAHFRINVLCSVDENIVKNENFHFAYGRCQIEPSWSEEKEAEFQRILKR